MNREYYSNSIEAFVSESSDVILGIMTRRSDFDVTQTQRGAWLHEVTLLQGALSELSGKIYFEYSVPRMGRRIDVLLVIKSGIFVLEFKVGEARFSTSAIDQVWDYALDLKNFHSSSHTEFIVPVVVATEAEDIFVSPIFTPQNDRVLCPIKTNSFKLKETIETTLDFLEGSDINVSDWESGRYSPTPTIVEAAMALYRGHAVENISRNDAGASNLSRTSAIISEIIQSSRDRSRKSICFVTGVPGAGKTLVGLDVANKHTNLESELYSVFLSGNGPLVKILCEALARDKVQSEKEHGRKMTKKDA